MPSLTIYFLYEVLRMLLLSHNNNNRYFAEPWACAVFHDRFNDFADEVREYLGQLPTKVCSSYNSSSKTNAPRAVGDVKCVCLSCP